MYRAKLIQPPRAAISSRTRAARRSLCTRASEFGSGRLMRDSGNGSVDVARIR
jgi:hypothetical protein